MRTLFYFLFACLLPSAAEARPRDEVMSSAYHCATIGDSRQWLDCYYGAAQPQRHELGLPPALPSQLRLAASPPGLGSVTNADTRSRVMQAASQCYGNPDDRQWLNCYYNAAGPMRSALGLVSQQFPTDNPTQREFYNWGQATKFTQIVSRMKAFSFDDLRNFTVTLSNGQVWQQVAGDTNFAHWNKPAASYLVIVKHGAFGSVNLQVQGNGHIFKVKRLR